MSAAAILPSMMTTERRFGAQSMSAPLLDVLVKRPGPAFGAAFDEPAHGFHHPVDLDLARREHDAFVETLSALGPRVHVLETELSTPDLVYTFDPLLVTDRGAIPLRPGKPNRAAEPAAIEAWTLAAGIPTAGRIEAPGTIEGGDTYWRRPTELIHLLSVVSPVADDLAVVFLPLLPVGLWELLNELGIRMIEVPEEEFPTLGCNVLAIRPGVVILAEGNHRTSAALAAAGCEV